MPIVRTYLPNYQIFLSQNRIVKPSLSAMPISLDLSFYHTDGVTIFMFVYILLTYLQSHHYFTYLLTYPPTVTSFVPILLPRSAFLFNLSEQVLLQLSPNGILVNDFEALVPVCLSLPSPYAHPLHQCYICTFGPVSPV